MASSPDQKVLAVAQISDILLSCAQRLSQRCAYSEADTAVALTNSLSQVHLAIDRLMADVTALCLDAIKRRTKCLHEQVDAALNDELGKVKELRSWIDKRENLLSKCQKATHQLKESPTMDMQALSTLKLACDGYSKETDLLEKSCPSREFSLDDKEASSVSQKLVDLIMRIGTIQTGKATSEDSISSSDCISLSTCSVASTAFNSHLYSAKSKPTKVVGVRHTAGPELEKFNSPRGCVSVYATKFIAVADSYNNRIKLLDSDTGQVVQNLVFNIERAKTISSKQLTFTGLTVDYRGHLYMADAEKGSVFIVDIRNLYKNTVKLGEGCQLTDWPIVGILGTHGFQQNQFNMPVGIAVDANAEIICVCDSKNHQIKIWNLKTKEFVCSFGECGKKNGQFVEPSYCAITNGSQAEGESEWWQLAVSDSGNNRIQMLRIDKVATNAPSSSQQVKVSFMLAFGKEGSMFGNMSNPRGVAFDPAGYLLVADAGNKRIQVFMKDGTPVCSTFASTCGIIPEGVAVLTDSGGVVVSDRKHHVVDIF